MKKLGILLMLVLALTMKSHQVLAQSVTIPLLPGWNWISVPLMDTLDFQTAMGSVIPMEGDIIKSRWGAATYTGDHWRGSISQFYPGYGYHYKSNRTMPVMVTFTMQQPNPQGNDHEYVDLGLPSGTLWAICNVGANSLEEYGDYFAWGETEPKDYYGWSTYQYCNGSSNTLTKYCINPEYGYNGFTDSLTTLLPEDDAATSNWGVDWRIPTKEEWQELHDNTISTWTTQNGVNGRLFTASNGNSLFLPAGGCGNQNYYVGLDYIGWYCSSSLHTLDLGSGNNNSQAWHFFSSSESYHIGSCVRYYGQLVRPVRSAK